MIFVVLLILVTVVLFQLLFRSDCTFLARPHSPISENERRPVLRAGLVLVAIPFVLLPIYFWFVFYFAIDSICIPVPKRGTLLGSFFIFTFYPVALLFLLPGAIALVFSWTEHTLLRWALAPLLTFALWVLLVASSMLMRPFYPNHLRAEPVGQLNPQSLAVQSVGM